MQLGSWGVGKLGRWNVGKPFWHKFLSLVDRRGGIESGPVDLTANSRLGLGRPPAPLHVVLFRSEQYLQYTVKAVDGDYSHQQPTANIHDWILPKVRLEHMNTAMNRE